MYVTDTVPCEPGQQLELVERYKATYPPETYGTLLLLPLFTPSPLDAQVPYALSFYRRRYPMLGADVLG